MKIAVLAANGRTGQAFVHTALNKGHSVLAGVHRHDPFKPHERLTVHTCDATNEVMVKHLITGADAVVSFIGHRRGSPPRVQTSAAIATISGMEDTGIRRIVSLTGVGARMPGDIVPWFDKALNGTLQRIDPARISDGVDHLEVLERSGMDWTVMRVLKLTNGPAGKFRLRKHGPAKLFVSRNEVALAVLQVLEQASYFGEAPIIGRV